MKRALRIAVTLVLLGGVVWYVGGVAEVAQQLAKADLVTLLLACLVVTADRALVNYKWLLLLRARGVDLPFWRTLQISCAALIWGMFMPSTLGADGVRGFLVRRLGVPYREIIASIAIERMIGFICSVLVGLLALGILVQIVEVGEWFQPIVWGGTLALVGAVGAFAISTSQNLFDRLFGLLPRRFREGGIGEKLTAVHAAYLGYSTNRSAVRAFSALTLAEQFLPVLCIWIVGRGLGVEIGIFWLVVVPLVTLISRIPVSIDGLGVFEGTMVALLSLANVEPSQALSVALLVRILQILSLLPWWISLALRSPGLSPSVAGSPPPPDGV